MRIPASHGDLLDRALPAALVTHLAGGRLQASVVWYWRDGDDALVSTMTEFVKARNLRARPRAGLLVLADGRWLELRATVSEVVQDPAAAMADLDGTGLRYCGAAPYFGRVVPAHLRETEHPVTFRLVADEVVVGSVVAPDWADDEPAPDEPAPLPNDHLDLLEGPALGTLATTAADGRARTEPAWCGLAGTSLTVATTPEQGADLARDPRATLLVVDPKDSSRWVEVRADAVPAASGRRAALVPRRVVCDAIHR